MEDNSVADRQSLVVGVGSQHRRTANISIDQRLLWEADYLIQFTLRDTEALLAWWYGGESHRMAVLRC